MAFETSKGATARCSTRHFRGRGSETTSILNGKAIRGSQVRVQGARSKSKIDRGSRSGQSQQRCLWKRRYVSCSGCWMHESSERTHRPVRHICWRVSSRACRRHCLTKGRRMPTRQSYGNLATRPRPRPVPADAESFRARPDPAASGSQGSGGEAVAAEPGAEIAALAQSHPRNECRRSRSVYQLSQQISNCMKGTSQNMNII